MIFHLRSKNLVAQHIDVALVYKAMLGVDEALQYLEREGVSRDIAERVLLGGLARRASEPIPPPAFRCRRKNHVHDAIVEAALKIERRFGTEQALVLLRQESVPACVAERVTAPGPRQIRARKLVAPAVSGTASTA
jgi:predicted nucleic acid-binding Zn ribbon protein